MSFLNFLSDSESFDMNKDHYHDVLTNLTPGAKRAYEEQAFRTLHVVCTDLVVRPTSHYPFNYFFVRLVYDCWSVEFEIRLELVSDSIKFVVYTSILYLPLLAVNGMIISPLINDLKREMNNE